MSWIYSVPTHVTRRAYAMNLWSKSARPQMRKLAHSAQNVAATVSSAEISLREAWMVNIRNEDWLKGPRPDSWYTGKRPIYGECPGVLPDGTFTSLPLPRLDRVNSKGAFRKQTQDYFDNTWTATELLFAGLESEEYFYRPPVHGLRHPQIFYYGHSPCLYVNKLRVAGLLDGPVNSYYESIYEVGVDEMLWDDMFKNDMVWPTVKDTHGYRRQVYEAVSDLISRSVPRFDPFWMQCFSHSLANSNDNTSYAIQYSHPDLDEGGPVIGWDHPLWALFMSFEHERIHLETSSVLFREAALPLVQV